MSNQPSVYTITDGTSAGTLDFIAPGSSGTSEATSMCIQPGTFTRSTDQNGNVLHAFQAFQRTPAFTDERQYDTLRRLQLLLYEASQISENGLTTKRVTLDYAPKGSPESAQMVVMGGSVWRVDDSIVDRFNSRKFSLYNVVIRLRPQLELKSVQDFFLNVDCHDDTNFTVTFNSGTDYGRIERVDIWPKWADTATEQRWRYFWLGIKPNTAQFTKLDGYFESKIRINDASTETMNGGSILNTDTIPLIGGAAVKVVFDIGGRVGSKSTVFEPWTTSEIVRSGRGWLPRFLVPIYNWGGGDSMRYVLPGKYHLLSRIAMPPVDDRYGYPRWGVRGKLVYGEGISDYKEIASTGELYLPHRPQDGEFGAWYDLGSLNVGADFQVRDKAIEDNISVVIEAALMNQPTSSLPANYSESAELTKNYLILDDLRLVPAESFIFVALPDLITREEALSIFTDDNDNVSVYITKLQDEATPTYFTKREIKYRVNHVSVGANGFKMPPGTGHAVVAIADYGPDGEFDVDANAFRVVDIRTRPRIFGGEI